MPWRRRKLSYKSVRPMFKYNVWKILTGDLVEIVQGKDKGKQGIVKEAVHDKRMPKVKVEGCNLAKRKIKRDVVTGNPGGFVHMEMPIHYFNVMLVDPITKKPVRVVYKYTPDGEKVRVTKGKNASYSVIPTPHVFKDVDRELGPKDTPAALARERTYFPDQDLGFQQTRMYSTYLLSSNYQNWQSYIRSHRMMGYAVTSFWWRKP
eukprot:TRINITY_DN16183_c0_g1_i1.p2 TRINITY_DN16183_c0_g1~~TRINITY_DN16183_c0_g1_i1.p2  ORF type:complete len:206 (-),score=16.65 TRINITY_DN16183_c0_g1_i1:742-1359(-)